MSDKLTFSLHNAVLNLQTIKICIWVIQLTECSNVCKGVVFCGNHTYPTMSVVGYRCFCLCSFESSDTCRPTLPGGRNNFKYIVPLFLRPSQRNLHGYRVLEVFWLWPNNVSIWWNFKELQLNVHRKSHGEQARISILSIVNTLRI